MNFIKHFIKAFVVGILVFLLLVLIQYANGHTFTSFKEVYWWFLINQIYAVILYMVNAYYFQFLLKYFPDSVFKVKNLTKGALFGILLTLFTLFFIRILTETLIFGKSLKEFFAEEQISNYYVGFIISVVVTSIFYAIYYYKNKQEKKVVEQKIIAGTASAKFDALKNQLDPHFLFNSLNVLTSLIEENPQAATTFTTTLSKVYRYVLEQKNKSLVTLEEEMHFAKLYMSLLMVRFEDSIVFSAPSQLKNPEAKVVPLSLQLLLENAVKHNQVTSRRRLHISITEGNNYLKVTNNLQPKQVVKESSGVGLKNIIDRYGLLTDHKVEIVKNDKEFAVVIPLLVENYSFMDTQKIYISEKRYLQAKKRVNDIKAFYLHLVFYLLFVPVFIYLNIISTDFPWALFPLLGWGFGVSSHAMEAFNYHPMFGKKWEERKIRELMEKENNV